MAEASTARATSSSSTAKRGRVSHVAIYDGNGRWYEATRPGRPTSLNRPWTGRVSYGRV